MRWCEWRQHSQQQDVTIFKVAGCRYPLHSHRGFHELLIVLSGRIRHRINGEVSALSERELVLVREEDCHELIGGDGVVLNLPFTVDWLERVDGLLLSPGWTGAFLSETPPQVRIPAGEWTQVQTQLNTLLAQADSAACRPLFANFLLNVLVHYLPARSKDKTATLSQPAWLRRIIGDLGAGIPLAVSVAELARWAECSPEHLARTFRRYLNASPVEYLNAQRIRRGANLLRHTNLRIKEIAIESGFATESYFCRQFLKLQGMRPGTYRKLNSPLLRSMMSCEPDTT